MTFLWPHLLWLLALLAAVPPVYVWLLRRRKRALIFSNLGLMQAAIAGKPSLRRHLPPALLYAAVVVMTFALARPTAVLTLPSERATIILAMDVSGSMRARDVEPSRIEAAQHAARNFISGQPRNVRIGLVAFAGNAMVAQMPTLQREDVLASLDHLQLQRRTAVGSGIVASLGAIFPELRAQLSLSSLDDPRAAYLNTPADQPKTHTPAVPPGSYASAVIILLSDGRTNAGVPPIDAAQMAADRGVRVYTVGFGTAQDSASDFDGWGGYMRMQLDEETLKTIADITKAKYYNAQNSADLEEIYKGLSAQFVAETKRTEITGLVALPALALMLIALLLSMVWSNRMT